MLIKHKISLSFLAAFILLVTLVAIDFQSDVSKADKIAQREAMAIAKTMAFTIVHTAEDMASSPEGKEKKFQQIIENFSEHQRRDIVVVDSQKRILADVITEEVGTVFNHDPDNEVGKTLQDGKARIFKETSKAYPEGINQLVIPLDISSGERIGALVLEYTPLYKDILVGVKQEATRNMIFYTAILGLGLVAGYAYVGKLVLPLREMRKAAREIAAGKESALVRYDSPDELGELATSFNKMALDVAGARKDLLNANEQLKADIERRKKAEESLIESEQRMKALLDAIPDMIIFKDTEGVQRLANKVTLDAFGGPEAVLGKTAEDLLPPDAAEKCRVNDEEVMRSQQIHQSEETLPGKDGEEMHFDTIRIPIYDAHNNTAGLVVIIRDVTERKKAEETILNALREKEVLLHEVHHRVKNNLAIIVSLLRLQSGKIEDKDVRSVFRTSQNRVKAMALVHEKLYSEGNLSEVNFESYVKKLARDIRSTLPIDGRKVHLGFDVKNVFLNIDVLIPCGLIINELVTNALKHAFNDHDSPEIRVGLTEPDDGSLRLSVADNGCGIPEDFNINDCTSLGLMIVQSLVVQIRGALQISRDNGTRFDISFEKDSVRRKEPYRFNNN